MTSFYLPNFEDLIDPDYDFVNDVAAPGHKDRWEHDRYAHELFDEQIFDGMLVSKASLTPSAEIQILKSGGIHSFTRLDRTIPTMADCGAFTFLLEEKPVYSTQQVIDYYRDLGFDYGVSLDHLAFVTVDMLEAALANGKLKQKWWDGKTTEQIQLERFDITLKNAQDFINLHSKQNPKFYPVGIAQGRTPEMYSHAVQRLIQMGYSHLALGGLIKSSDEEIVAILKKIAPQITHGIKLHIFGVARLSLIPSFLQYGVTSVDSASPLRRAFLGTGQDNYWTSNGKRYAAIRVPEAGTKRKKRGVSSPDEVIANDSHSVNDIEALIDLEKNVLSLLRRYDTEKAGFQETLDAVLNYDRLYGEHRNHEEWYVRTLKEKPWKECTCPICQKLGIEVIIFRGNNRNRRRGFHNVKIFYEMFKHEMEKFKTSNHQIEKQTNLPNQLTMDFAQ